MPFIRTLLSPLAACLTCQCWWCLQGISSRIIVASFLDSSFTALHTCCCQPPCYAMRRQLIVHCCSFVFPPVDACSFCHSVLRYNVVIAMPMPPRLLLLAFLLSTICVAIAVTTRFTRTALPVLMKIHCHRQLIVAHCSYFYWLLQPLSPLTVMGKFHQLHCCVFLLLIVA